MKNLYRLLSILILFTGPVTITMNAQAPTPIIVQAATALAAPEPKPITPTSESTVAAIKLLRELKAANEETLKKQQAVLERLDELQKAADQIRIFAARG